MNNKQYTQFNINHKIVEKKAIKMKKKNATIELRSTLSKMKKKSEHFYCNRNSM